MLDSSSWERCPALSVAMRAARKGARIRDLHGTSRRQAHQFPNTRYPGEPKRSSIRNEIRKAPNYPFPWASRSFTRR